MKTIQPTPFIIALLFIYLCFGTSQTSWAEAVPVQIKQQTFNTKTKFGKRQILKNVKKLKHSQKKLPLIPSLLIAWYALSIGLLIVALIFSIPALLITSIVLLLLPITIALILGLILLFGFMFWNGSLC